MPSILTNSRELQMTFEAWLSTLEAVSDVSHVQPSGFKSSDCNAEVSTDVAAVSNSCVEYENETVETSTFNETYQEEDPYSLDCTAETAETSSNPEGSGIKSNIDALEYSNSYCWPKSTAMNAEEIKVFKLRLERLEKLGLKTSEAERLCDRILRRDREGGGEMRSCFECRHLVIANGWFCKNWKIAGVAIRAKDAQLPIDLVVQLQRCSGFSDK
jgi:hypothetical protein